MDGPDGIIDFAAAWAERRAHLRPAPPAGPLPSDASHRAAQLFCQHASTLLADGTEAGAVAEGLLIALAEVLAQTAQDGCALELAELMAGVLPRLVRAAAEDLPTG